MDQMLIERFIETLDGLKKTLEEMKGNIEPELKPCPFCGSDAKVVEWYTAWFVQCHLCQSTSNFVDKREEAIEAWNRRV